MRWSVLLLLLFAAGCRTATVEEKPPVVVDPNQSLSFLQEGLVPEILLFPEYLLMEDFQLNQHGRIPDSELIGVGMHTALSLREVRTGLGDVLVSNGWEIDDVEIGGQSFRMFASRERDTAEFRVVQGSGLTHLFLLYDPYVEPLSVGRNEF